MLNRKLLSQFPHLKLQWLALLLFLQPATLLADTIVSVQTNLGQFTLELFEDKAPATVAHFLANLEAGNYQFSMVHEATSVSITGGSYFFDSCSEGPVPVPAIKPVPIEDTGLINSTRTLAMVPNSNGAGTIGSQWLINLGNNEDSFEAGEKPVVFGEVVDGLSTVDLIADAWRVPMGVSLSVPTVNYDGFLTVSCQNFNRDNVVKTSMVLESLDPPGADAANVFDEATSMLNIKVDAGTEGLLAVSLMLQSTAPDVILQAQPETVSALSETVVGISTFDAASGQLTIPELVVNGQVLYTNLVLQLTDADNLFFTLQSFNAAQ